MPGNTVNGGSVSVKDAEDSGLPRPQDAGKASDSHRNTGLDFLGNVPWGTHVCQFYQTKQDLLDIALPYLRAGLENNEFCLWVACDLLNPQEAFETMMSTWPGCEQYVEIGQMRFLDHSQWYLREGPFDAQRMIETNIDIVGRAINNGYEGMRIVGNMTWFDKKELAKLEEFEEKMSRLDSKCHILNICSYRLDGFDPVEAIRLTRHHHSIIFKHAEGWQTLQNQPDTPPVRPTHETEPVYRRLFDSAQDGMAVLDVESMHILLANSAAARILGFDSAVEAAGASMIDFIPAEDRDCIAKTVRESWASNGSHKVEDLKVTTKDGKQIRVGITSDKVDYQGKVAGLVTLREVAGMPSNSALADSEEMQAVFDSVRDAVVLLDMTGKIVRVNKRMLGMMGYGEKDLIGNQFALLKMFPPSRAAEMFSAQARTLAGHDVPPFELEAIAGSGGKVKVEVRISPMKREGKLVGAIAVMRDITERHRTEEKLQASQDRNQLVVQNANEGIMVVQDGSVMFANPKMIDLAGCGEEEILHKPVTELIHPDDRHAVTAGQFKRLRGEELSRVQDMRIVGKDGRTKWAEFNAVMFTWDGRPADLYFVNDITRRKESQDSLLRSENNYKHLLENTLDGIEVVDAETGKVLIANVACARIFGFEKAADMIEIDPLEYIPAEERERAAAMLSKETIKENAHKTEEFPAVTRDGRSIRISATCVSTEFEGKLAGLVFIKDLTGQRQAEEWLKESQADMQVIFDGVRDSIALLDATGKVIRVNKKLLEIGEDAEGEVLGKEFTDLKMITPESMLEAHAALNKALSGEEVSHFELQLQSKSDKKIHAEAHLMLLKRSGKVVGSIVVLRDITDRKQAELALRNSEERYRLVAENASDVIWIMNMDLRLSYVSPAVDRLRGYGVEETMSQTLEDILTPASVDVVMKVFAEEKATEDKADKDLQRSRVIEMEVKRKDGSSVWTEVKASFLRDLTGKAVGILGVTRDIGEQKRARYSLEDIESRYRLLAENVTDIIWTMDVSMKLTYVSPSVTRLRGYSIEEALAAKAEDAMTPESVKLAREAIKGLLGKKNEDTRKGDRAAATVELEMRCKDGTTVWTETRMSLVNGMYGRTVGIIGITRDISERKKAEKALLDSERRYRLLAENVSDVIWVTDLDLRPTYVSPSIERVLGYNAVDALASGMEKLLTQESSKQAAEGAAKAKSWIKDNPSKAFKPGNMELEFVRKDGSSIWADTTVTVVCDAGGKPVEIMGVLHDVTSRKKSEKALSDSEGRFRSLIETTSDWVWEVNEKFIYTYVSSRIRDILGYEPAEVIGKTPFDLMPMREASRVTRVFESALAQKKPFAFVETACLHKDSHKVVLETSGVPFLDAAGNVCGFRGIDRDVTERKRAEEEVQDSFRKLQRTVEGTIQAIALTVETRDPYTAGHQRRVTQLAYAISREMGLSNEQIQKVRTAGLLHDLGKIFIPTEILSKPGQLTDIEFAIIKSHPQAGYEILKNIEFPWPIADIVVQHHERLNGSGYPLGLKDEGIVIEARILAVADIVEAMSSHRPYRPALGLEKALKEISSNKGTLYDADAVDACLKVFSAGVFKFDD